MCTKAVLSQKHSDMTVTWKLRHMMATGVPLALETSVDEKGAIY